MGEMFLIVAQTSKLIKQYFENKAEQLLATSRQAICEHNGLKGSHREDLIKIYLSEVIPKRFEIGHGMIYGQFSRSNETDIVLWDSYNFPNLKMNGHSMYFAESVNAAIEIKTNYTSETEADVSKKTESLKSVITQYRDTVNNRLFDIEQRIESLMMGSKYEGCLSISQSITSCAVFINGGANFTKEVLQKYEDIDTQWPDLTLFLKAGKVAVKCIDEKNRNLVRIYNSNKDSLLMFTKFLLEVLSKQVVLVEGTLYFDDYIESEIKDIEYDDFEYISYRYSDGFKHPIFSKLNDDE